MAESNLSNLDVKPEVIFAHELVQAVAKGAVRIPRFQRKFVWRRDQMRDLLDSIRRRYPIGSLLVWDTEGQFRSSDWVGPVRVPTRTPTGIATYVLDGQQRLTTLAGVLLHQEPFPEGYEGEDPEQWSIYFDLKEQEFVHLVPKEAKPHHFPMWKLLDTFEFLREGQRLLQECGDQAQTYVKQAHELANVFRSYKLPIIRISSTELTEAVDIFARLNSTGQRVTPDEIVSALTYREASGENSEHIDLAASIDELIALLYELSFGGIARVTVLRIVMAALGQDIYRTNWTKLFSTREDPNKRRPDADNLRERLPEAIDATKQSLRSAVVFLKSLGVHTARLLPYAMQFVALSEFFRNCPDPSPAQTSLLQRWFWVSSFSGWFGGGNPARTTRLVNELREIAQNPNPTGLTHFQLDEPALPLPSTFDLRSARVRTHVVVMLSLAPCNRDGKAVEDPWRCIESKGPIAFSYIFSHGRPSNARDKELRSGPANRILNVVGHRGQAKTWLREMAHSRQEALQSHAISDRAIAALESDDAEIFLAERTATLIALEQEFMKQRGVTLPRNPTPHPAPLDSDFDDSD